MFMDDLNTETPVAPQATENETPNNDVPSQDPVKAELEREQRREFSPVEKAAHNLKMNAERLKELGGNPEAVLGVTPKTVVTADDDTPVTMGMLQRLQAEQAQKTALQLADEIPDESERALTKMYLQNRVRPSGNPQDDLRFARAAVNSVKNGMIAEELGRKPVAQTYSTGSGAPAKRPEGEFVPTETEAKMMAAFGLTKEQVLKARQQ